MEAMEGEGRWVPLKERNADFTRCFSVLSNTSQVEVNDPDMSSAKDSMTTQ